jgi:hypothetical protein
MHAHTYSLLESYSNIRHICISTYVHMIFYSFKLPCIFSMRSHFSVIFVYFLAYYLLVLMVQFYFCNFMLCWNSKMLQYSAHDFLMAPFEMPHLHKQDNFPPKVYYCHFHCIYNTIFWDFLYVDKFCLKIGISYRVVFCVLAIWELFLGKKLSSILIFHW